MCIWHTAGGVMLWRVKVIYESRFRIIRGKHWNLRGQNHLFPPPDVRYQSVGTK
jgi:hypothetical protein